MDVYDEVDRRETDAGRNPIIIKTTLHSKPFQAWVLMCVYCDVLLSVFTVWLATQNHSTLVTDTTVVPFLPVNPEYSSTRNQASGGATGISRFGRHFIVSVVRVWWLILRAFAHLLSQGRQKLARFSAHEFATLVIDILTDAKRRQWGNSCDSPKGMMSCLVLTQLEFFACVF